VFDDFFDGRFHEVYFVFLVLSLAKGWRVSERAHDGSRYAIITSA
jgi:hypothetical protein